MAHLQSRFRQLWLPAAWCLGAMMIVYGSTRRPFDPTARQYRTNWPGDVRSALIQLTIEVAVLYLLLRPRSYAASWARSPFAVLQFSSIRSHG